MKYKFYPPQNFNVVHKMCDITVVMHVFQTVWIMIETCTIICSVEICIL